MRANRMARGAGGCLTCSTGGTVITGEVMTAPMAAPAAASSCGCVAKSGAQGATTTAIAKGKPAAKTMKAAKQVVR